MKQGKGAAGKPAFKVRPMGAILSDRLFLPCSCQRSKKNPQSRVHSAALRRSAALDCGASFFAFRVHKFRPEGGQYGS